ncbi:MAG: protein-disulfide reductase DsbD family protein [candidate division KSB1 bacterium]|nr:protein-disulfide reductase DsbD family protein [candidate division KSB1 bacterium]
MRFFFRLILIWMALTATAVKTQPVQTDHVEAELIAEVTIIRPGQPFWAGIRLKMEPYWHVYWKNPGDSGMAPSVEWHLPRGFAVSDIFWPYPEKIDLPPLANFGYEGEVVLLVRITPPDRTPLGRITLKAEVDWLVCREMCLPGNASLKLTLPVRKEPPRLNTRWSSLFERMRARLPLNSDSWRFRAGIDNDSLRLTLRKPTAVADRVQSAFFFPEQETLIQHAAPQRLIRLGEEWQVHARLSDYFKEAPDSLRGVLVLYDTKRQAVTAVAVRAAF